MWLRPGAPSSDTLGALAVFGAVLLAYIPTLSPGVEGGDPGEFQIVPYVLGIPHQTGYPLYVLLGKLWTLLPIGSVAYRMNLFSALFAALTASLAYLILRGMAAGWLPSLVGGVTFALSPLAWFWSTLAGVRSMAVFFVALLAWLGTRWKRKAQEQDPGSSCWLYALALSVGLALTHHRTIVLAIPGLALLVVGAQPRLLRRRDILARIVICIATPLLLYLFLWIRGMMDPPLEVSPVEDLGSFLNLVLAPSALEYILIPELGDLPALVGQLLGGLESQFTVIGMALGLVGLWAMRRRPLDLAFLFSILGLTALFAFVYGGYGRAPLRGELVSYLLPVYFIFALWIGMGADKLGVEFSRRGRGKFVKYPGGMLLAAALVLMLVQQGNTAYQEIQRARGAPLDHYRQALRGPGAIRMALGSLRLAQPGGVILSDWEQFTALRYYQLVEGWRPDLEIDYPLDNWAERFRETQREARPFYLTRHVPEVVGQRQLSNEGPLVRFESDPSDTVPSHLIPLRISFEEKIELIGYGYLGEGEPTRTPRLHPGGVLAVQLYWQAGGELIDNYSISVRLLDAKGNQVASSDNLHPVLSLYPTSLWKPGEIVGDYYELLLPNASAPGEYHLEIIVYLRQGGDFRNLTIAGTDPPQDRASLDPFLVF